MEDKAEKKNQEKSWTSLVVQGLRQCREHGFSPRSRKILYATEVHMPAAHALQQEKPLQWEAGALLIAPTRHNQRKPVSSNK